MAQISRPFQVVLAAFALLVLVWFFALHRPASTTSSSTPIASSPAGTHKSVSSATASHTAAHRAAHTAASDHAAHTTATKGSAWRCASCATAELSMSTARAPVACRAEPAAEEAAAAEDRVAPPQPGRVPATSGVRY